MVKKRGAPTLHPAKRIVHRNEHEPLRQALSLVGWKEAAVADGATIVWDVETLSDVQQDNPPAANQLVNRIPAMLHCCRKGVFARVFARTQALLPPTSALRDGRYVPAQWALPLQTAELAAHTKAAADSARARGAAEPVYIVKPDSGSQGDGIALTSDPTKPSWNAARERVVQEYIASPLTLDGLKFDLRLCALAHEPGRRNPCPLRRRRPSPVQMFWSRRCSHSRPSSTTRDWHGSPWSLGRQPGR